MERHPTRYITLPDSWEGIEMSHGQNWRSNHRRKWKKMLGQHAGRPLQGGADLTPAESLDALMSLHSRRWSAGESLFLSERTNRFHRKLVQRWLPQDRLSINLLELNGAPGAATYCFHYDGRSWFYQAGWNADYSDISIGKMAVAWAVQCAIQRGLREFDFLPGDLPYKQEWSNAQRSVVDIEAFNPLSLRASVFRLLRFCKRRTTRTTACNVCQRPPTQNLNQPTSTSCNT
ncbi:MAG: GNAT family N-acetyltransferase [Verrucomicrobia bacterium]|nr:GNAT family N-acetyltransferase [Verrucomicrobiota bacterium]